MTPSKASRFQAALLESLAATAGAGIVTSELLLQQLVAVNDANTALDLRFGRESPASFAHCLEKNGRSLKLRLDMAHLTFPCRSSGIKQCPSQESNLDLDLRRVACDPAHSKDILSRSTPPRS